MIQIGCKDTIFFWNIQIFSDFMSDYYELLNLSFTMLIFSIFFFKNRSIRDQ